MKIIAVAGGSGCGKTLFSELLVKRLPESVVLPLDCYYLDRPNDVPIGQYNFDSPNAFDFDLYNLHLDELSSGNPIQKPKFSWGSGKRRVEASTIKPKKYLIIEGLHILLNKNIRKKIAFSFYLESPLDVAVSRRCLRDMKNHFVSAEHSLGQYLNFVRPIFFELILPTKKYADVVVANELDCRLDIFIDNFLREKKFKI